MYVYSTSHWLCEEFIFVIFADSYNVANSTLANALPMHERTWILGSLSYLWRNISQNSVCTILAYFLFYAVSLAHDCLPHTREQADTVVCNLYELFICLFFFKYFLILFEKLAIRRSSNNFKTSNLYTQLIKRLTSHNLFF